MKTTYFPLLLLLCIGLIGFSSCEDDDTIVEILNYDGDKFSAPQNGAGLNSFAAFFPATEVSQYEGRQLEKITFWLETVPTTTSVIIFANSGNTQTPGDELYRVDLTQRVNNSGWIDHIIPGGQDIPADGLWLAVETDLAANGTQSMGCDDGSNYNPNGDRMRTPTSGIWSSFNAITGSQTINWNIRGTVAPL
jgi:hypothetical protein